MLTEGSEQADETVSINGLGGSQPQSGCMDSLKGDACAQKKAMGYCTSSNRQV